MRPTPGRIHPHKNLNPSELRDEILAALVEEGMHWRTHPVPGALRAFLHSEGIEVETSLLFDVEIDPPGGASIEGKLVTIDRRVWSYELDCTPDHSRFLSVNQWEDITDTLNTSDRNKGFKFGFGLLLREALEECNRRFGNPP